MYNSQLCPVFQTGAYAETWTETIPNKISIKKEPRIQRKTRPQNTIQPELKCFTKSQPKSQSIGMKIPQSAPALTTAGNLGAYRFLCGICKKAFSDKRHLADHRRRHEGKSYRCEYCPKSFAGYRGLELHTPVHTGKYPFNCSYCPDSKGYNYKKELEAHEAEQHGKPLTVLNCKNCRRAFLDKRHVGPHEEKCIAHY